jgi:hypothetical protein
MKTRSTVVLLSLLGLWLGGCASIHSGKVAEDPKNNVRVSAAREGEFSDANHVFVAFTMENKGKDVLRVVATDLEFDESLAPPVNVLVGNDLVAWAEANEAEQKRRQQNQAVGQLAMILGGAALGVGGRLANSKALALVGATSMTAGLGWSVATTISHSGATARSPQKVPDTHVYRPFSVPVGLYVRRWAVIQKDPKESVKKVLLKVKFEDGTEQGYALDI